MNSIRTTILLIILTALLQIKAHENNSMPDLNEIISNVKKEFAPDKRTAIFTIDSEEKDGLTVLKGETNLVGAKAELLSRLNKENIKYVDSIEILPAKDLEDKIYGIVNLSVANIRTEPGHSAEMASQVLLGTQVNVLKKKRGWYLVQTPDEYISWTDDDGITLMNETQLNEWRNSKKQIFISNYGFSYSLPDVNSIPVSDLVKGDLLKLVVTEKSFFKVEYPDKRVAYIPEKDCMDYETWLSNIIISQEKIVSSAKSFMGIPYLWGGTSMKGVDCSGFTKTVYFLNGIILPRDASQQVHVGELIDTKDGFDKLEPGDLLFFGRKASDNKEERATHVGIYIGNDEFIHSSGMVRINSLNKEKENFSEYRFNTFLKAKRILTSLDKNGVYLLKNHKFYSEEK